MTQEKYTVENFIKDSARTVSNQFHINTEGKQNLLHAAIGLATEANELSQAVNHLGEIKDKINMAEEIGDLWWYWALIVRELYWDVGVLPGSFVPDHTGASTLQLVNAVNNSAIDFLDYIGKKVAFYGKPISASVIEQKLLPLISASQVLAERCGYTTENCMERVVEKLKVRYPEKFTLELAENRDLGAERKVLES